MLKSINISRHSKHDSFRDMVIKRVSNTHSDIFRTHLCGYDFNLTYPQQGKFPPVPQSGAPVNEARAAELRQRSSQFLNQRFKALVHSVEARDVGIVRRKTIPTRAEVETREYKRRAWLAKKNSLLQDRDLSGRANGTLDPWYGCFLTAEVQDYALNFSLPWSEYKLALIFYCRLINAARSYPRGCYSDLRRLWPFQRRYQGNFILINASHADILIVALQLGGCQSSSSC